MNTEPNNLKFFLNLEVEKALTSYLDAKGLDPKSISKYLSFYHKFANVHAELNQETLDEFLKYNNNSPARAMVKHLLKAIRRWDFPQEIRGLVANLDIPERSGKREKKIPLFMTHKELDYLIGKMTGNSIVNERDRLVILTQWWAGLRISEVLGIGLEDLESGNFDESKEFQRIKIKSESAKYKKEGYGYIPTEVYKRIAKYIAKRVQMSSTFARKIDLGENIWNFNQSAYGKLLRKKTRQILGRSYNTHSLRHGRATDLIDKEVPIDKVKEILRHSDITSTQRYLHTSSEEVEKSLK